MNHAPRAAVLAMGLMVLLQAACDPGPDSEVERPKWTDLASQVTGRETFLAFRTASIDSSLIGCGETPPGPCARVALTTVTFPEARPQLQDALHRHVVDLMELELGPEDGALTAWLIENGAAGIAHEFLDQFREFAEDFPDSVGDWFLDRSLEVVAASPDLLTVRMTDRWYTGGAHPNGKAIFRTLDMTTGAVLGLPDLLSPGFEVLLRQVAEAAFREERGLGESEDLAGGGFFEATAGRFELNDNFAPTSDGLAFHFDAYEIAAYAAGPTDFVIPWTKLQSVIPVGGPLADFVGTPNHSPGAPQ